MKKTVAIIGSSRRDGNTGKLIDWIAEELDIEVIDLCLEEISPYDYEHKNINDDFLSLMNRLMSYDNIIFASPVYWFSMSAQMKVLIDRISDFLSVEGLKEQGRQLRGKVAYVVSTSINEHADDSFLDPFINTFDYLGMGYGGAIHACCKNGFETNKYQNDVTAFVNKLTASNYQTAR